MEARDAATGQLIWEHKREMAENIKSGARAKTIAIGFDMVYWTSPDSYLDSAGCAHRRAALGSQNRNPRRHAGRGSGRRQSDLRRRLRR